MVSEPRRAQLLVLGKDGQLGRSLQLVLGELGEVYAVGRSECDLENEDDIRRLVREVRPAIVVNAAAYTAVDKAEEDVARAMRINARAPGVLAKESAAIGAPLIHFSTDYVFDGNSSLPYTELDLAAPLSVYGKSKWEGEEAVRKACHQHYILRTSWVFAAHGQNFLRTILRLAKEREHLRVVADQFGTPTPVELLSSITAEIICRHLGGQVPAYGTYHATGKGYTSWHEYARFIVARANAGGAQLKLDEERVQAIPSSEYQTAARRPLSSRLDTSKLNAMLKVKLPAWQDGVQAALDNILGET